MATGITLKVTPNELKSKAGSIKTQITNLQNAWKDISSTIDQSKNYWEGDASDAHQKSKREIEDDVTTLFKRLLEHPNDLLKMADIYEEAEQSAESLANTLPGDVIV